LKTEQNPLARYHPRLILHHQNTNGKHIVVALLLLPPPFSLQPFLNIVIPSQSPKNSAMENAEKQKL
jgi:hypothetical protein